MPHRHQEAQLGCLAVAPLYLCSCLCLCASAYHGDVDVSLQQIYLPVHLRVIMHAYFCMCASLYAIWSLGVSFFSICSSRLWRKADPLGWIGSKVIWLRICQLGIRVCVYALKSQIAFHTIGGCLRVYKECLCVVHYKCSWTGVVVLTSPTGLRRLTHALPLSVWDQTAPYVWLLCCSHAVVISSVSHFQCLRASAVCLFIFLFVSTSCLPVYPTCFPVITRIPSHTLHSAAVAFINWELRNTN